MMMVTDDPNRPQVLGLDLDGVCADFMSMAARRLNDLTGLGLAHQDVRSRDLAYEWGVDPREADEVVFNDGPLVYRQLMPIEGFIDGYHALETAGYTIRFLTARHEGAGAATHDWLTYHLGVRPFDVRFGCSGDKSRWCDILVDDDPDELRNAKHPLLFAQPWNEDEEAIPLVLDWPDLVDQLLPFNDDPYQLGLTI